MGQRDSSYRDDLEALEEAERRIERELAEVREKLAGRRPFDPVRLRLARPCDVAWDAMKGDERKRFCASCKQDVWNVAELTTDEVMELVGTGTACFTMLRRADGTIVTRECGSVRPSGKKLYLAVGALGVGVAALGSPLVGHGGRLASDEGIACDLTDRDPTPTVGTVVLDGEPVVRPASDEVASFVLTQAADFREHLWKHRATLLARGVDVDGWMVRLGTRRTVAPRRAPDALVQAMKAHDGSRGPRALAKKPEAKAALPNEPVDTSEEIARLSLACRSLPHAIRHHAPELANHFVLDAMGE